MKMASPPASLGTHAHLKSDSGSLGEVLAHQCVPQGKVEGSLELVVSDGHQVKETRHTLGTTSSK